LDPNPALYTLCTIKSSHLPNKYSSRKYECKKKLMKTFNGGDDDDDAVTWRQNLDLKGGISYSLCQEEDIS